MKIMRLSSIAFLYVFVSFGSIAQFQENIKIIANWQAEDAPEITPYLNKYHDVWGVEINDREFAIMSTRKGTHIIDITDVEEGDSLESLHFIEAAYQGENAVHRDFHDYNGYLYVVCDEGPSTLQIIDIRKLPEEAGVVYDSNELFKTTHNIFIDTAHARLYTAGANPDNLQVISLENPEKPELMYTYDKLLTHDLFVRNNIGFLNQGNDGFEIVEFGLSGLDLLGTLTEYEDNGYNHSGWLSDDGKYYALCDENHGYRVKLLDVSDYSDIKVVSLFGADITDNSIPHNVIIKDHYAFVSYYYDGLQVFDFSDPEQVEKVAQFDTYLEANDKSFKGVWGVYPSFKSGKVLVSDMQTGLYVFKVEFKPIAEFNFSVDTALALSSGSYVLNLSSISRGKPNSYSWTINGVEVSNEQEHIHNFDTNPIDNEDNFYEVCLEVSNSEGSNKTCETLSIVIVGINEAQVYQNFITHINNHQLIIQYTLTENQKVSYSLNDFSGRMITQLNQNEVAGSVQHTINLSPQLSNNILILTLQSGNAIWSKKINTIH